MEISLTSVIYRIGLLGGALVLGTLCLAGCGDDVEKWWRERTHTQITLIVEGDETIQETVYSFRLQVYADNPQFVWFPTTLVYDVEYSAWNDAGDWGRTFAFAPPSIDDQRMVRMVLTGYDPSTAPVVRRQLFTQYRQEQNETIHVELTADCLSVFCPGQQATCAQGRCVDSYVDLGSSCSEDSHCDNDNISCTIGRCAEGRCVPAFDDSECADDERCLPGYGCEPANVYFQCSDGTSVSRWDVCNGVRNCPSGEDEDLYCQRLAIQCWNGDTWQYVALDKMCDGNADCMYADDEDAYYCESQGYLICPDKRTEAVEVRVFCDGTNDCADKSDEEYYWCYPRFICDGDTVIYQDDVCDGWPDCMDGADEAHCASVFGWW
jgi:hypothetical protein